MESGSVYDVSNLEALTVGDMVWQSEVIGQKWPLTAQTQWQVKASSVMTSLDNQVLALHSRAKVLGDEVISVPAGTFHCYIIENVSDSTLSGKPLSKSVIKMWYCPEVKHMARFETTSFMNGEPIAEPVISELKSFSIN